MSYKISRKIINEMVKREQNISSRRSSGGSGAGGSGGVSSAWVDEHYVSKDFFARLFTINGTTTEGGVTTDVVVKPNDLDTDITNIQAMVGLWTEQYLSALGQGSGGGGGGGDTLVEPLASINESSLGAPTDANVVIAWDGVRWSYKPYVTGGGGGGGSLTSVGMSVPAGFKVSNGDSQTITTSGTFALSFGGSIAKNRVLASPSDSAGAPSWRKLVADDIPDLSATYVTNTAIAGYKWWGQKLDSGVVKGDIFMLSTEEEATLNTNSAKLKFNSASADSAERTYRSPYIQAIPGYGGYGKKRLSVFQSDARDYVSDFAEVLSILPSGNIGIGVTSPGSKLEVGGTARINNLLTLYREGTTEQNNPAGVKFSVKDTTTGQTYSSAYIVAYQDHGESSSSGVNFVMRGGGNIFLGGGDAPSAHYSEKTAETTVLSGEHLFLTTDGATYIQSGASTVENRKGICITSGGHIVPCEADMLTDETHYVGTRSNRFLGMFAKRYYFIKPNSSNDNGAVYLEYDSQNGGVHLVGAGLYTDTYVSALGAGSGGGGGSTTLTEPLATINEAGLGTPSAANQVIAWNGIQWSYMPFTANTGTVTSVNGSAASGSHLTVTGGPITTSGALTIGLDSGYSIPKTSKQTNWDTAYTWVYTNGATISDAAHTHSNKSVLDDISSTNILNWGTAYSWVNTNGASTVTKTAWGQTYWNAGVPQTISGTITVGNGDIVMNNNKGIKFLDVPAEGSSAAQREVLRLSNNNTLLIGQGTTAAGYNTRLYGNAISFRYGTSGSIGMTLNSSGNLGIGTTSPSVKLDVNGYAKTTRLYLSSSVYLEYDSTNSGVHLVGAGLYADTYVSALGAGSGGGSGSGITMADVWSALATPAPSTAQEQIEASHLTQALSGYASKTWVQQRGYLTSNEAVTLSTAQTISAAKIFGAGLKSYSICIETKIDGTADTNRSGEINRYGSDLHLQYHNQTGYTAGGVTMCNNGGCVAIGYSSQDSNYKLKVNGKVRISDQIGVNADVESDAQCMLNINGTAKSLGWNSYSDFRLKDVINPVTASVEDIANVRIFDFRWKKDGENGKIHFGSAAQDWQKIFPHAVVADNEGFLSMDYAGIAVGAVKTVAQEVVLLKKRVAELEKQLKAS